MDNNQVNKTTLRAISEEENQIDNQAKSAEENINDILFGLFMAVLVISVIGFFTGLNGVDDLTNAEETMIMATSIYVGIIDIICFVIARPLIAMLVGISRNLRELNNKTR